MKLKKIVCVDNTKLGDWAIKELHNYAEEVVVHKDYPTDESEVLHRIKDAEIVLVSWHTQLTEEIIVQCPKLKYIGMACSLYDDASANIAVSFARQRGIEVKGIKDYGDPGVVEFIVSELVRLLHGFGENMWQEMPVELTNRKIGIIGLGTTGQLLAECMLPFKTDLYYYSRTRKKEWEERGVKYLPLHELLQTVEIVSIHLPKNTTILKKTEFSFLKNGKILINTSLGTPFKIAAFEDWIADKSNYAIFDADGCTELENDLLKQQNIIAAEKSAGWSEETAQRLSKKVLENLKEFYSCSISK